MSDRYINVPVTIVAETPQEVRLTLSVAAPERRTINLSISVTREASPMPEVLRAPSRRRK